MYNEQLWEQYYQTKDLAVKNQIIQEYFNLVKTITSKLYNSLGGQVEFEDLYSYGVEGLISCIDKYRKDKGVKFETYASIRIKGAMLDYLRKMDTLSRGVRSKAKQIQKVINDFEETQNRTPTNLEISKFLGLSVEEVEKTLVAKSMFNVMSLEEAIEFKKLDIEQLEDTPEKEYAKKELKDVLTKAIELLKENEKTVISLYYYEELMLKDIAEVLGVTLSRASQIHSKAISKIKLYLEEVDYIGGA